MSVTAAQRSRIDLAFAALSDPTRRAMVELLGREEHRAGALAEALDLAPPAASKHLRVLKEAGLVEERAHADARVRVYALQRDGLRALHVWLDEVERFWEAQLDSFSKLAEERAAQKRARVGRSSAATTRRRPPSGRA